MNLRIACKIIKRDYLDAEGRSSRWFLSFRAQVRYSMWWRKNKGKGREFKDKLRAVRDADGVLRQRRSEGKILA